MHKYFSGSSVFKASPSYTRGSGSIPCRGAKFPPKNLNKNKNLHLPPLLWKEENLISQPLLCVTVTPYKAVEMLALFFNQVTRFHGKCLRQLPASASAE